MFKGKVPKSIRTSYWVPAPSFPACQACNSSLPGRACRSGARAFAAADDDQSERGLRGAASTAASLPPALATASAWSCCACSATSAGSRGCLNPGCRATCEAEPKPSRSRRGDSLWGDGGCCRGGAMRLADRCGVAGHSRGDTPASSTELSCGERSAVPPPPPRPAASERSLFAKDDVADQGLDCLPAPAD